MFEGDKGTNGSLKTLQLHKDLKINVFFFSVNILIAGNKSGLNDELKNSDSKIVRDDITTNNKEKNT